MSGSSLFLSLVLVMFGSLVMGMGVPSGAAYLIIAIVLGPALERLGLPTISAHLFVVYFGVLSVVTPPVALAAFAAAPIAGSRPMETGFEASRLAIAGFIIPFLFVYHPDVLLIVEGFQPGGLLWAIVAFSISTWAVASGIGGFDLTRLGSVERAARVLLGLLALMPNMLFAAPATAAVLGMIMLHFLRNRRQTA